jgi:hypothetical protein
MRKKYCVLVFLCFQFLLAFSQDTTSVSDDDAPAKPRKEKGFQLGFFAGTYFANKYTSSLYDGYGLDANGQRNDFWHSAMYTQIVLVNGGYYAGQPDRIATALNVQHGEWSFGESDMPVNLKYNIAFMAGANLRYALNKRSAILLNANTSKLVINGDFTIETQTLSNGNQQPQQIKTFSLAGGEQRLLMQLGYQQIFGDNDKLNFFAEGGVNVTMAKFIKNQINVNGFVMDLTSIYYSYNWSAYRSKYLTGVGLGAFAGLGMNITLGNKWLMQLVYNPSYELVKLGAVPKYSLNHAIGVRGYYTF